MGAWNAILGSVAIAIVAGWSLKAEEPLLLKAPRSEVNASVGMGVELADEKSQWSPCSAATITATPSRPTWTGGAATTQCGVLETDFGWLRQRMGDGTRQEMILSSVRYGVNKRMDVRWGAPGRTLQTGDVGDVEKGITDQSLSVLYRFLEQRKRLPALAFSYGLKIPSANPSKGFGSGYTDHQFVMVASRDLGSAHADFNATGMIAGGERAWDGAIQMGLAVSIPVSRGMTLVMDNLGGSQPCTRNRFGAVLLGSTWAARPWLVFDAAYARSYTAGAPRQQFAAGFTVSTRPRFPGMPGGSKVAKWMGR